MAIKSAISFGLVHIPIALHTTIQDNDIHFNQLHKAEHQRIRYKETCGHCGQDISSGDIVKGYEYDKDQYVIVTDDEIEKVKTEKQKTIRIPHFANLNQISPIYYEKNYHAVPRSGGEKAFELLWQSLMSEQKIAIAKTVLGTKDMLMALTPCEDGILLQIMFYEDGIKELTKSYTKQEVSEAELNMAKMLISSVYKPFEPAAYKDEYQERLRELISAKIAVKEVAGAAPERESNVIDLMESLKQSIEKNKTEEKPATKKKRGA